MGDNVEPDQTEQVDNSNPQMREQVPPLVDAVDLLILDSLGGLDV